MPVEMIIGEAETRSAADTILTDSGFYWRERDGVRALVCAPLEDAGFVNAFSTRLGGVSPYPADALNLAGFGEDTDENINENRRRFLRLFEGDYRFATVWQTHSDSVKAFRAQADLADTNEKADAAVSDLHGVLAGVKTADCVPVLIGDPQTRAFAAVHAGWRGTNQSIVVKTIMKMSELYGTKPAGLICAVGPAAGCSNYEIGSDVIKAFEENFAGAGKYFTPTREGHALIDLHAANRDQLADAGVPADSIFTAPLCTMERTDLFFSYRVEKQKYGRTGRLLSVIGRR